MLLRKPTGAVAMVVAGMMLGACTLEMPTKKVDYQSSVKLPSLEVPPDLTRPGTDNRFSVPDVNPKGTATYSDFNKDRAGKSQVATAQSRVLPKIDNVRVERAGTERWLVVPGSPDQIWPVVKEFWQETGFVVNVEKPEAGVMETDWAENRANIPESAIRGVIGRAFNYLYSTAERDKFRTRLERGGEAGTTEIYISHRGMEEVFTEGAEDVRDTRWVPRPPNPDLEAEMLRLLMVRFGMENERAKTQIASAKLEPQARLNRGAEGSLLALNDQFDRAWRRVGLALDRVGFTVEDRDRSKGLYFVRYIDPDSDVKTKKETGWLSSLKFWGSSDKVQSKEQYRILVQGGVSGAEVSVLDKEGIREKSDTANRILTLLYDQLK
ncbi:MAG: outer membrane protein assembly factor BamC [Betaproteobacteria bacterium]|nr:outer membrane protein assembly factor BamC [Betaproteobacteria bacterium]